MNDSSDIYQILQRRHVPAPASNLSSRITEAARIPAKKEPFHYIQEILQVMEIPRPAYALAMCLVIGLFTGLRMESSSITADQYFFSFIEIEEDGLL